jgi:hypothetical protein
MAQHGISFEAQLCHCRPARQMTTLEGPGDDSFPMVGGSINLLVSFVHENGGDRAFQGLTTDDVKNLFVIPATVKTQQSMCQLLQARGDRRIGRPSWFVSHAWKYTFLQLLQAPNPSAFPPYHPSISTFQPHPLQLLFASLTFLKFRRSAAFSCLSPQVWTPSCGWICSLLASTQLSTALPYGALLLSTTAYYAQLTILQVAASICSRHQGNGPSCHGPQSMGQPHRSHARLVPHRAVRMLQVLARRAAYFPHDVLYISALVVGSTSRCPMKTPLAFSTTSSTTPPLSLTCLPSSKQNAASAPALKTVTEFSKQCAA